MSPVLYRHQEIGALWLSSVRRALLADEQGLGKTATAIIGAHYAGCTRVLVLAPASVLHNWKREIAVWAPDVVCTVLDHGAAKVPATGWVVTTHDLLRSHLCARLCAVEWDLVVVDEAQNFRNRLAKRTRALFGQRTGEAPSLAHRAARVWCLTGTPMPNDPTELWTVLRALAPERILMRAAPRPLEWLAFRARYCTLATVPYGEGVKITGAKNVVELQQALRGFMLRRLKKDHLELPPVRWGQVSLSVSSTALGPLRELEDRIVDQRLSLEDRLERLRNSEMFSTWRRMCGELKAAAAAELLIDELQADSSKKLVVFAYHTSVVNRLAAEFTAQRIPFVEITGSVPAKERTRRVEAFQGSRSGAVVLPQARVALCNLVAGGVGITLTAAHDVVFVEQSYVPGENAQAADRVHRIGQSESVLVRVLTLAGSVDEHLAGVTKVKRRMIDEVMS